VAHLWKSFQSGHAHVYVRACERERGGGGRERSLLMVDYLQLNIQETLKQENIYLVPDP